MNEIQDVFRQSIILIPFLILFWFMYRDYLKRQKTNEIKINNNSKKILFICNGVDDLGDNMTQLYGQIDGGDIYPTTNKLNINGNKYEVFEIYADEVTLDKPSKVGLDQSDNVAIVIKDEGLVYGRIRQDVKKNKVIAYDVL